MHILNINNLLVRIMAVQGIAMPPANRLRPHGAPLTLFK